MRCGVSAHTERLQTLSSPETDKTGLDRSAHKRSEVKVLLFHVYGQRVVKEAKGRNKFNFNKKKRPFEIHRINLGELAAIIRRSNIA